MKQINYLDTINTSNLVETLVKSKQNEMSQYQNKISQLKADKKDKFKDPIDKYKHTIAKIRYNQLKRTTKELWLLEQKIKNLQNYSEQFVSEIL